MKEKKKETTKKTRTVKETQKEERKEVAWPGSEIMINNNKKED